MTIVPVFRSRIGVLALALVAFALGAAAPRATAQVAWGIPLKVDNPTDIPRVWEPVASGIAVPQGTGITNPNAVLGLKNSAGVDVPVQFKVLSRWGGTRDDVTKEVKWVLVEFFASVPANGTAYYGIGFTPRTQGGITVSDQPNVMVVNTGPSQFVFDKTDFSFFEQVFVAGQNVLDGPGRLQLRDVWQNLVDPIQTELIVEEAGDVRTVVRQKGELPGVGLQFTIRYYFWSGRRDVKVDFRLENDGGYGHLAGTGLVTEHAYFSDLALALKVAGSSNTADVATGNALHPAPGSFEIRQSYTAPYTNLDMLSGFLFTESSSTGGLANWGFRHEGAMGLNADGGAISIAVDRFWQNFPKAYEIGGRNVRTALWPAFGNGPEYGGVYGNNTAPNIDSLAATEYRFEGGRWKTYTLSIDFREPGATFAPADVHSAALRLEKPLMAQLPLWWPFQSFAFSQPLVERRDWNKTSNLRYEQMVQVLADDDAADNHPNWGKVGLPAFRNRGGTYGGNQFYGWTNFGDVVWGDGFCSGHYDLPWGVLINWYRTGDYKFFDVGRDMVNHRRDYDQFHSTDPSANKRGGQFYEKGWTHGNYQAPTPSHTWVNALVLYYVMTGDEGAREAAVEVGDFIFRQHPENWNGLYGARILGWQIEGLMHLWSYLGDAAYLQRAQLAIINWEQHELAQGANGVVMNGGWNPAHAQSWMQAIVMSAIGKYTLATNDTAFLPLMDRMANYFQNDVIGTLPNGPSFARSKGFVWERFDGMNHWDASAHHKWATIDALTYGAMALHRQDLMQNARLLWESMTRYHQASAGDSSLVDFNDPSTYDRIGFKLAQYPGSETKVMSNMALWGQTFMAADLLWDQQF
ncbi:MAG: hypothetical protein R3F20_05550 [Planctomycetota bacterium]